MVTRMAARKAKVWRLTEGQRQLVEENLSLARWAVNYWANHRAKTNRVSEDDLLGAAYEGLCRAACRYDPRRVFIHDGKEKRAKFSTYAVPVMLDAMSRLCRHAFVITMPQYVCQLRKDRIGNHHLAALDQVAQTVALSEEAPITRDYRRKPSVELPHYDEIALVRRCLEVLPKRLRQLIHMRFYQGRTLVQVGAVMRISKERVRQLQDQAFTLMRAAAGLEAAVSSYTVRIPNWMPTSLNKLLGNWRRRARLKKADQQMVAVYCHQAGVPKASGKRRVNVTILQPASTPGRMPDPDNLLKSLLDALVQAGMLVDDSSKWLTQGKVEILREPTVAALETVIELEDIIGD